MQRVQSRHLCEASLQVKRVLRTSVLLTQSAGRGFESHPPHLRLYVISGIAWPDSWTDVGRTVCRRGRAPFRSHRATAERLLACQTLRREDPLTDRELRFRKPARRSRPRPAGDRAFPLSRRTGYLFPASLDDQVVSLAGSIFADRSNAVEPGQGKERPCSFRNQILLAGEDRPGLRCTRAGASRPGSASPRPEAGRR